MNLLHVCSITNNKTSGISNVVPEHFLNQQKIINTALLNCGDEIISRLENHKNVFYYNNIKNITNLPKPFNKPDLVIFHGIYIFDYIKIYKYLKKNKIPYIIIPHGSLTVDAQKIKRIKKIIGNTMFFNKFIKNSKSIQFLSTNEKEMSPKYKYFSFVQGNGMFEPNFEKVEFTKNAIKLIYVGRYSIYHKGLDILLEGCALAHDIMKKKNISVDLYGSGNDGIEKVRKIILDKKIADIVNVNGPIFDDNKAKTIINSDFFVQLSRLEGQPLGIMEAMFLGMPIICSDGTTFMNVVKENKCGYTCSTPSEFYELMKKLTINEKKFKKMGESSKKVAKETFSWDIVVRDTIKKYKEIIKYD